MATAAELRDRALKLIDAKLQKLEGETEPDLEQLCAIMRVLNQVAGDSGGPSENDFAGMTLEELREIVNGTDDPSAHIRPAKP